jgi:predicted hydrocarbon binding protein
MTTPLPFPSLRTVAVPIAFFSALRRLSATDATYVNALRDAGYAAGVALVDHFEQWLTAQGELPAELLPDDRFSTVLAEFLGESGWGAVRVSALSEAVMVIDADEWAEADGQAASDVPSCHVGTGMLAGLLGRVANAPLSVLEVECRSTGQPRCRFLAGSVDVMQYVYEAMARGVPYEHAATSAATG